MEEWKPPKGAPGPIYGFRRGYNVNKAGKHENSEHFSVFQKYLMLQGDRNFNDLARLTGKSSQTLIRWSKRWCWQHRAASYDKDQTAIVWKEAEKLQRNAHKEAVIRFQQTSERHAVSMANVAENILRITNERIAQAEANNEEIPLNLISGLLRSASSLSEQSRQSWANSLGVSEMMNMVEQEIERAEVQDVTDLDDAYDIPLDE